MSKKLNSAGSAHASSLIDAGKVKDASSWSPPSADREDAYIRSNGIAAFGKWHLGYDPGEDAKNKGRYAFIFTSDFERVDLSGLRACITRAAQSGYSDIQKRAQALYAKAKAKAGKSDKKSLAARPRAALARTMEALSCQPWHIRREAWEAFATAISSALDLDAQLCERRGASGPRPDSDFRGNPLPKMQVLPEHGTAVVPVMGVLMHHASDYERRMGACSYDDIKEDLWSAANTPGVSKVVMHIDSPGGMALGNDECAAVAAECAELVRLEAVTDSQMCSAAYLLASPAAKISCTRSAQVGAIGCFMTFCDTRAFYERLGASVKVFSDGIYKGAGTPGTSLTKDQEAYFQGLVEKYGGMFKAAVQQNRIVGDEDMQGQVFIGSDALDAGLVDSVVDQVDDAFSRYEPDEDGDDDSSDDDSDED